jgi:hypothetical protein
MKSAILTIVLLLPLAACGSKPTVDEKNASVEQVANKVAEVSKSEGTIRPGQWQSTMTIEEMDMPGMPPEARDQMKKMFAGNEQCRYDHFTMGNGKIDAEMHCNQAGSAQTMTMAGTYGPDSYAMHMTSKTEGGPAGEAMSMKMRVEAKRVGECTAKQS